MGYAVKLQKKSGGGTLTITMSLGTPWSGWNQTIRASYLTVTYLDSMGNSSILVNKKQVGNTINGSGQGYEGGTYTLS